MRFNLTPAVRILRTHLLAHHQARLGKWEQCARDRARFRKRILELEPSLEPVLYANHRQKIYCDRFLRHAVNDISNSAIDK